MPGKWNSPDVIDYARNPIHPTADDLPKKSKKPVKWKTVVVVLALILVVITATVVVFLSF